jgi:hypothetical protein
LAAEKKGGKMLAPVLMFVLVPLLFLAVVLFYPMTPPKSMVVGREEERQDSSPR